MGHMRLMYSTSRQFSVGLAHDRWLSPLLSCVELRSHLDKNTRDGYEEKLDAAGR